MLRHRVLLLVIPGLVIIALALILTLFPRNQYTVIVGDNQSAVYGRYKTVREILEAGGIDVLNEDLVFPPMGSGTSDNMTIRVQKAVTVALEIDNEIRTVWTHRGTLGSFLQEVGLLTGSRSAVVLADGKAISFDKYETTPLPSRVRVSHFKEITIRNGLWIFSIETRARTVGEALLEAGLTINGYDRIQPPAGAWLYPGLEIQIQPANEYTVSVDNQTIHIRSQLTNTLEILSEFGIGLVGLDFVEPDPAEALRSGDTIRVVRVTTDRIFEDETIGYQSSWQGTDQLELDQRNLLSAGSAGLTRHATEVRFENGVEFGRQPAGTWVLREPVNEVIGYGTNIVVYTLETPDGHIEYWRKVRMWATSYTAASAGKPRDHPGYGITASGVPAGTGVIAVDPKVIPFRSQVYITGYGVAFAGDTGGGVKGRIVDLGYDEGQLKSWNRYVDVYYLTPIPPVEKINFILPD